MKINELSDYQVLNDVAEIILSVDFPPEVMEQHKLVSTTVFVSYNLEGKLEDMSLADEGFSTNLELTEEESQVVKDYIEKHGLEKELMKRIQEANH